MVLKAGTLKRVNTEQKSLNSILNKLIQILKYSEQALSGFLKHHNLPKE